jgi:sec-independent protein translocase protein TatA
LGALFGLGFLIFGLPRRFEGAVGAAWAIFVNRPKPCFAMNTDTTPLFLFLGNLSTGELILIFAVVLLLFGAKRIPELARGLGKGIREFKDASSGIRKEIEKETETRSENRS